MYSLDSKSSKYFPNAIFICATCISISTKPCCILCSCSSHLRCADSWPCGKIPRLYVPSAKISGLRLITTVANSHSSLPNPNPCVILTNQPLSSSFNPNRRPTALPKSQPPNPPWGSPSQRKPKFHSNAMTLERATFALNSTNTLVSLKSE